ncbi:glycosyltransferase family 4 protein [Halodesulfovibrio sp.]|uniref:glycosyltransferase family 4 protein n=1 Tax=Halodesulfovibrio sp. TaxID=1912772 RepID=UPI0025C67EE1|nr:glycosyltransferase family 4 protein [Halodesulfovibrio sp.]
MKVIIFSTAGNLSGGVRQAANLAKSLMRRGHEVVFFVVPTADIPSVEPSITWRRLPVDKNLWRHEVENEIELANNKGMPCVVQAFHNKANKYVAWWAMRWALPGSKYRAHCVGYRGVTYRPRNPLPYWSFGIKKVVVNSAACGRLLSRQYGISSKIELVYNSIPEGRNIPHRSAEEVRKELGLSDGDTVFGTVTSRKADKGNDVLLESFAKLNSSQKKLLLVGLQKEHWISLCRELGIEDRVIFVSYAEHVADYLQLMDCFVFAGRKGDSTPNALLEAMSVGVACVGTHIGGVPEVLSGCGKVVPINGVKEMTEAMQELHDNPLLRKAMAATGLEKSKEFTEDNRAMRVEEIYSGVIERYAMSRYPSVCMLDQ